MKKKFQLVWAVIILTVNKNFAQVYFPLPMENACWRWYTAHEIGPGIFSYQYYLDYTNGDTIINSKLYTKIYRFFDYNSTSSYFSAIRQDTVAKLIYYVGGAGVEDTLYDFNQTVGQSMNGCSGEIINTIDSVLIGSTYRKRRNVTTRGYSTIEGIGNTQGLFNTCTNYTYDGIYLLRMVHGGTLVYHTDPGDTVSTCNVSYSTVLNLIKKKNQVMYCFYNAGEGQLEIVVSDDTHQSKAEVYDINGKKIALIDPFYFRTRIDLTSISSGIYLVSVKFGDGSIENKKFVISK